MSVFLTRAIPQLRVRTFLPLSDPRQQISEEAFMVRGFIQRNSLSQPFS